MVLNPVRVLHVLDHSLPHTSGYALRSLALMQAQRARGWLPIAVTSLSQGPGDTPMETLDGLAHYRTPTPLALSRWPGLRQIDRVRWLTARLIEIAKATRPALLHAHSPSLNGLAALQAGRALDLPVAYEIRAFWEDAAVDHGTHRAWGIRYRLSRALESFVVREADQVFVLCEPLREELVARGIDIAKIAVVPNAVDATRFAFRAPRDPALEAALDLAGRPVLGFIGSFYAYEGLLDLVAAVPRLRAAIPDLRVLLVGQGPVHAAVAERVKVLGLEDTVLLPGAVPPAEVPRWSTLIDVACYPRRRMRLTDLVTPLKPLEAMALGQVVLASDVGGHRELIHDGVTGRLFAADDDDALVQAVTDCFTARDRWPDWRATARAWVAGQRTWAASVEAYAPAYAAMVPVATALVPA